MSETQQSPREILALCRQREIRAVDLRFTDFCGTQRHFTIPADQLREDSFEHGFAFDGSSMRGWQSIHESDMLIVPESQTSFVDPFMKSTLAVLCNVKDPVTHQSYPRDPRNIARKAENYMLSTGLADDVLFGAEAEFYVFDSVRFDQREHEGFYYIDSMEGQWGRGDGRQPQSGYRIRHRDGYLPMPPMDSLQDLRTEIMLALEDSGIRTGGQHHELGSGGQCEVDLQPNSLLRMADNLVRLKYLVRNVAARYGKTATFMPKPLWNDNGSGLHLHLSLWKDENPLFAGSGYGGLSETAMFAMGGILQHAPALLAFCCPTTNSFKRLMRGLEAPVNLAYSYRNRSAAIRIPANSGEETRRRFEFRCPDSACNPYLALSAILMAMLDGIQNRTTPGRPQDKDLYDLEPEERDGIACTPASLDAAMEALEQDNDFLLRGDVFTPDVIERWVRHKRDDEINAVNQRPHPYEFALYFDC
ncbi:MAG: type I glutamate--ammonia ligase [Planctomycetaceae bacterium]|nr:type I glutamate--ammonia ligase [Planctomycetaceae bacterium]